MNVAPLVRDWVEAAARMLRLAEPSRLAILDRLSTGPKAVEQLVVDLDFAPTVVCYHVRVLVHLDYLEPSFSDDERTLFALTPAGRAALYFARSLVE